MKFGRIFNKGSKNALREDLAVSDPGSEDSWDQLFQKVPLDNATKEGPAAVLPPINLSNRSTAFCPSNVQSNPVKDSEKDLKGRTSVDKNSAVSKNVSKNVHVATTSISKNAKQGSSHSNVQQLNPVTSTPFGREKPAPSFEFSPIILSVKGNEHNAGQEDASLSVDSNASLVVKRKSSARQKDAFDRLLDPRKRVGEETTCQFPGILPLKCLSKEVDTTRQYAGGIIRGEKTYQEQFLDFVSDEATLPESQKEVPGRTQSPHSHGKATEKCKEIPVDNVVGQIQSKEDLAPASNEKSPKISIRISAVESAGTTRTAQIESLKSVDGNGCHNTNPQKIDKSPVDTLPLPASEIPQSDDDINFQKPVANKTALKKSSCEEIGPCESKSAKIKSLGNNQESEKESKAEMVSIPLVGSSTCLVAGEALKNQSNDGHLNEECQEPVKDGNRISGERMISYQSGFAIKVGNTCLKQSSTFTFALQGKSSSHLPLLNSEVQSKNLPQRKDLEEGVRSYYNSNILLSQKKSEKARQKSPEDLFRNAMKAEGPSSLSPKSKRPDSSVKNVDTLNVGCPPAKSRSPSTIEIRKNTPSRGKFA
ncbi:Proline--tRNA ligase [Frankliniella fusca]|uniref:Proline--tRNA ligase n=1 Tax=Frankliniella fusca TaxID=407009 RepID=A0AAE1HTT9_9NEOP|nr:Proline--tRNA ligase [Frankliniella fusca]